MEKVNHAQYKYNWIDWMKVIGLYAIISGHYAPPMNKFLYTFSVGLFFVISGFLTKYYSWNVFLKKNVRQLIIPLLLLSFGYNLLKSFPMFYHHTFMPSEFFSRVLGCIFGDQESLGPCWFVYTLILCKIIYQSVSIKISIIISILCIITLKMVDFPDIIINPNCFINAILAFPIFILGSCLKYCNTPINNYQNRGGLIVLFTAGFIFTSTSTITNSYVWMYKADYGESILAFFTGILGGTIMIYSIAKILDNLKLKYISVIADGSIIILAFHIILVQQTARFQLTWEYYLFAIIVLLSFIPIINLCKRYCPVLLGYR